MPFDRFDPFDPAQASRHHGVMAELRSSWPVARLASGVIVVSRYEDVRSTLNVPTMRNSHAARAPGVEVPPEDRLFFFEYDPPEHNALRRLLVDLLSRPRAERQAPDIRTVVEEILEPLVDGGRADLVQDFSVPLAGRMMMRVAGFPETDAPRWRSWIKDMVLSGFSFTNRNSRGVGFQQCYPEVLTYLDRHLAERAAVAAKPDDVLTRILEARVDGLSLTQTQERMILFSVVSAGTNTLVNFLSNTLLSLARDPELVETLRRERELLPAAVEESLRRDSPSMYITRLCAEATDVAGTPIEPGEKLLLGLASANRDGAAFPQPDEFRLDRQDQPSHLAFGWGSHLCLGAWVARQVGLTMLGTFLDLVASIELDPDTTPIPYLSPQGNGLDELRVRLVGQADGATAHV
jgi:cytochrome P450